VHRDEVPAAEQLQQARNGLHAHGRHPAAAY
jgi:hypothetical protein